MFATIISLFALNPAAEETKEMLRRQAGGPAAPLTIHLRQEIDRLNKVVRVVGDTLRTLRLAVAGSVALG
jgi:dynein heavy chain